MFVWKLKFSRKMSDFSKNMFYKNYHFPIFGSYLKCFGKDLFNFSYLSCHKIEFVFQKKKKKK